ncbi:hypothetical protein PanWU01x14_011500, partial [Parasponia andersonii]
MVPNDTYLRNGLGGYTLENVYALYLFPICRTNSTVSPPFSEENVLISSLQEARKARIDFPQCVLISTVDISWNEWGCGLLCGLKSYV